MQNIDEACKAGKLFEKKFAEAVRKSVNCTFIRFPDSRTKQPCDYMAVCPGLVLFLELKSTASSELPLIDIRPHQLAYMGQFDGISPTTRAGFVIQFRNRNNEIWYVPGRAMLEYTQAGHPTHLSRDYMEAHGLEIATGKRTPASRTQNWIDIVPFFDVLRASTRASATVMCR